MDLAGLGWRPAFLVNLPVGLATFAAGLAVVPATRPGGTARLDLAGAALLALALLPLFGNLLFGRVFRRRVISADRRRKLLNFPYIGRVVQRPDSHA